MSEIAPKELIAAGMKPGNWVPQAVEVANEAIALGKSREEAIALAFDVEPKVMRLRGAGDKPFYVNIRAENEAEAENVEAVKATMTELMRTPVIRSGAVMPDACPAGGLGTIPVGGVAASEGIHPGMHSADICCSMALSVFPDADPADLLNAVHAVTHFGPGGRDAGECSYSLLRGIIGNPITKGMSDIANRDMGTQGDGNHFAYVGTIKSTGETALVTHHGSRGFGARVYKAGMAIAERHRRQQSPETLKGNAWIPADTKDGEDYWAALQIVRNWTKENHFFIHGAAATHGGWKVSDRFWNEHNFVFRKSDGLFYHGKGATPAFDHWADDATDLTIIPLNMAEPILIARGRNADNGLGFSPHGAGRNFSRTKHKRSLDNTPDEEIVKRETHGIDARFFMGIPDISELPSAYKNAASVRAQIDEYGLAEIVDEVIPYGCIMAGDWEKDAPWRKGKPA